MMMSCAVLWCVRGAQAKLLLAGPGWSCGPIYLPDRCGRVTGALQLLSCEPPVNDGRSCG